MKSTSLYEVSKTWNQICQNLSNLEKPSNENRVILNIKLALGNIFENS